MFVQIMQGHTDDAEGISRQLRTWETDLRPGAPGFLGSTSGVTADGTSIAIARFASQAEADTNGGRPEQSAWWAEMEKYFTGPVTFRNSTDVETLLDGGRDDAGFVQVMQGRVRDRARLLELEKQAEPALKRLRPDLIGSVRVWDGDVFTEFAYFTSEAAARRGEKAQPPDDIAGTMEEWQAIMQDLQFFDLSSPVLIGPAG